MYEIIKNIGGAWSILKYGVEHYNAYRTEQKAEESMRKMIAGLAKFAPSHEITTRKSGV